MESKFFSSRKSISLCGDYDIPLWQCPSFLFLLMGAINLASCLFFYFLGGRYIKNTETIVLITLGIASLLFIVAYAISRSLEHLVELNRTKTEFIQIVSHQLRAPLTNIRWSIEFLLTKRRNQPGDKNEDEYFGLIKENSQRLENLLSDLLIVSRLKEEGFFKHKEKINFVDVIKKIVSDYQSFAKALNVSITTKIIDKPILIEVNRLLVETALENIVKNAIVFNKKGGNVEIFTKEYPKYIQIGVRDEGQGIVQADRKHIFKSFFRGKGAFQSQAQGTGLGLYIAKAIITRYGGKIWFDTQEGKGTTFYITLPIKKII